jgi:hypothetical protein
MMNSSLCSFFFLSTVLLVLPLFGPQYSHHVLDSLSLNTQTRSHTNIYHLKIYGQEMRLQIVTFNGAVIMTIYLHTAASISTFITQNSQRAHNTTQE